LNRSRKGREAGSSSTPVVEFATPWRPSRLLFGLSLLLVAIPLALKATNDEAPIPPVPTNAPPTSAVAELPTVDKLMGELLARLPSQTVLLSGDLVTTPTNGPKTKLTVDILLSYPRTAAYTVRDAFGRELESLIVTRTGKSVSLSYKLNGTDAPAPSLGTRIQNTALTWMDITLGFLWWDGGRIIGQMETRGQPCYVLDRHAPSGSTAPYASVRMWVDKRVSMLLQSEGYDMLGDCIRRLSVKSFKKINDEWMVKDLEFEDLPDGPRTILRIRTADRVNP
jgi:hypothetical protein